LSEVYRPLLEPGADFDGYLIEEFVAAGGMAEIYRALDLSSRQTVALKVIPPRLARSEQYRERFQRELQAAIQLRHPNIVRIYNTGEHADALFLAMRFIRPNGYPRADLRAVLSAEAPLPVGTVLWILRQVADALDHAHRNGLVHRDVTPYNILVECGDGRLEDSRVYLTDFGITRPIADRSSAARTTDNGGFVGTLHYVAPEQILNKPATPATDTYALACVAYELLTGRPPYADREHDAAVIFAIITDPPPSVAVKGSTLPEEPGLATAADEVLGRAMAKDPAERTSSPGEFVAELSRRLQSPESSGTRDRGAEAKPADQEEPAAPTVATAPQADAGVTTRRRRWWWVAVTALVAVPVLALTVLLATGTWRPSGGARYDGGLREAQIALTRPASWHSYPQTGSFVLFSPRDLRGIFAGQPKSWDQVIPSLESDPASVVGVCVWTTGAVGSLADPEALRKEFAQEITGSRLIWNEDDGEMHEVTVGGHEGRSFAGRIRAPDSTDTLQIRAVAVPLSATGRTAHLVFFAPGPTPEPSTFEQLLSTFRSVQDSVSLPT
jgi:serine/threonine-protein kinase